MQFLRYDLVTNSWSTLANMPTAEYDAGAAYAANTNEVYVFGGLNQGAVLMANCAIKSPALPVRKIY